MKQDKEQTQVLLWAATVTLFLFVVFKLKVMEDIGHSPYIPWIAVLLFIAQLINHEQATISLRKKSPNFTNQFYSENGRMILGNVVASALVLEFNVFNFEHSQLNFWLGLVVIPLLVIVIFFIENSRGGFLDFQRIYFPKKWDQRFKAYGIDLLSILLMIAMWIPVVFKIPISALLWIFMSTLLLKASVIYTNKYNHIGWCMLMEGLLVLQLMTLGLQSSQIWLLVAGIATGIWFLAIYFPKIDCGKIGITLASVLFASAMAGLYVLYHGQKTVVFYLQREIALIIAVFVLTKFCTVLWRSFFRKKKADKYSYAGAEVDTIPKTRNSSEQQKETAPKRPVQKKTILLKKAEVTTEKAVVKTKKQEAKDKGFGKKSNETKESKTASPERTNSKAETKVIVMEKEMPKERGSASGKANERENETIREIERNNNRDQNEKERRKRKKEVGRKSTVELTTEGKKKEKNRFFQEKEIPAKIEKASENVISTPKKNPNPITAPKKADSSRQSTAGKDARTAKSKSVNTAAKAPKSLKPQVPKGKAVKPKSIPLQTSKKAEPKKQAMKKTVPQVATARKSSGKQPDKIATNPSGQRPAKKKTNYFKKRVQKSL